MEPPDQVVDATRRTRLAGERTYLAWWRSGLTALAVSLGAGKLVPELAGGPRWPYAILGTGYGVLGIAFIAYGILRHRNVEHALAAGRFPAASLGVLVALAVFGVALGIATTVIVLVEG